ncbi:glycylpeptide N-tetradecanoyltransferase 1-like [Salvia splendens]|uniref:glycylpeptide N-tetradecanoyltransferase 1-like n=1 Tax=Salvia splendens TaxID=180675 RepID=UPI001C27C985|nr:glycylpeptide N-tetradecanoyltransferase 1-like [Salvia splendens]XP_042020825.1 glycylpeptide N-tetradecanoyltransferase 1-like [Salvia splendens]
MADNDARAENSLLHQSNASSENEIDMSIDALASTVQESFSVSKRHKFWETQPILQFKDLGDTSLPEGPIQHPTPLTDVKQEPYILPSAYELVTCDLDSEEVCSEVYTLLTNHYVEDDSRMFRLNYSKEFLRWALCPPGYFRSWHIGLRVKNSKKLVAFISGIPAKIRIRDAVVLLAEVNFLCVHKKLRSRRLTPVMIKELSRRVRLENIWQAAYTTGAVLPTPITSCEYWGRLLNPKKLIDVGFSRIDAWDTMARYINFYKLPEQTTTPGLRKMEPHDVPAVARLLKNYLKQFVLAPDFDENEVEHWLLPKEDVMDTYVVESPENHEITDFCSFYTFTWSIFGSQDYSVLKMAYSYYNVSTKTPLVQLMSDALVVAKKKDLDVFNALDAMLNETFFSELRFLPVDGKLNYYLYNYRLKHVLRPSEMGLLPL